MIVTALIATSTKVLVLEAHQFLGAPKMLDDAGLSRDHTGRGWARPRRQSSRSEHALDAFWTILDGEEGLESRGVERAGHRGELHW